MQVPWYTSQRRGTVRTVPISELCCSNVLFVCKCVLYYCHRVSTQLQINISYHISYHKWYLSTRPQSTVSQKKAILILNSVKTHKSRKYGAFVYNFNIFGKIYNTAFKMYLDDDFSFLCMALIFTV